MAQFISSQLALEHNARILRDVAEDSGARMLVALKAFSMPAGLDLLRPFAAGCCASGLYEARLGRDCIGGDIAVYSPAYRKEEMEELLGFAHHLDFNSLSQWHNFKDSITQHPRYQSGELRAGLRINPCHSTGHTPLYDPCVAGSRLGIPKEQLEGFDFSGLSGLHFHTLCEQGFDDLLSTWKAFEAQFSELLLSGQLTYLNLGGGHWISKPDYDRPALCALLREIQQSYQLEVYLEPGEAWCIHTGVLRAEVLDIFDSLGYRHAILDVSASAHMPDVLEMPYRPDVFLRCAEALRSDCQPALSLPEEHYALAGETEQLPHSYRLGAPTCLAGDVIGDYSFPRPLEIGDVLVFDDMSHYTMVKTTHFNGVMHPDICLLRTDGSLELQKRFNYDDFRQRLG